MNAAEPKTRCRQCHAEILQTTADRTDGLCMPCKLGTRAAIEAGKRWTAEQRERDLHDPYRKLWLDLVHRVHETPDGFSGLAEPERLYFAVGLLNGEVYNGGFDQYFFNSSGSYIEYAIRGLREMGAAASLALLQEAKDCLFQGADVSESTMDRRQFLLSADSHEASQTLNELDKAFWKDPDCLWDRMELFAADHSLVARFA